MAELGLLTVTAADGQDLLAAAAAGWSRPVPDCPGWTAADLVGHMGAILGWMARIVTTGGAVPRPGRETPPADRGALAAWYTAQLDRTLSILAAAAPESPAWTFSSRGDHRVSWWRRRVAVEMAIHRWDAQHAAGQYAAAARRGGAAAGIEEFLTEFLPGLLTQPGLRGSPARCTCTPPTARASGGSASTIRSAPSPPLATARPIPPSGRPSDRLLWLTNGQQPSALDIDGPPQVAARWVQLRR